MSTVSSRCEFGGHQVFWQLIIHVPATFHPEAFMYDLKFAYVFFGLYSGLQINFITKIDILEVPKYKIVTVWIKYNKAH